MGYYRWFAALVWLILGLLSGAAGWWWSWLILVPVLFLVGYFQSMLKAAALIAGLIFVVGFFYAYIALDLPEIPDLDSRYVVLQGELTSYPQHYDNRVSFDFETENTEEALKTLRVNIYGDYSQPLKLGEQIELRGVLRRPALPGNPGQFDYRRYLEHQGIYFTLNLDSEQGITRVGSGRPWLAMLSDYRQRFSTWVKECLGADEAAILLGMLLGQKEAIDEERYSNFQKTGVVHLFAVSGLHVGFLMLLAGWLTGLGKMRPGLQLLISLILLWLYGSLVGWPVPVTRAAVMAALIMLAHYSGRHDQSFNALSLAGIIILLIQPQALFTVSFQLSFLAAGGLVWLFPRLRAALPIGNRGIDAVLVPLCAQLAVLPMIIYYFHMLSLVSIWANLLITWLACGAVILGFLAALSFPAMISITLYPAGMLVEIIMWLVDGLVQLPGAYVMTAAISPGSIICYYIGVILLGWHWEKQAREREVEWRQQNELPKSAILEGEAELECDAQPAVEVTELEPSQLGWQLVRRYYWAVA